MAYLYLARWEWNTPTDGQPSFWRSPGGSCLGCLDLRTIPQMETEGGTPGYGLFTYDTPQTSPLIVADLGQDFEGNLKNAAKSALKAAVGKKQSDPMENKVWQAVRQIFLDPNYYDPTGQVAPKPLRAGTRQRNAPLYLKGLSPQGFLFKERYGSLLEDSTVAVFRSDYPIKRAWVNETVGQEAERRLDIVRRSTGSEMRKLYGSMNDSLANQILPDPYKGDGWLPPETIVTDAFTRGDQSGLGGSWVHDDLTLFDIVSNQAKSTGTTGFRDPARFNSSLSSDDHYSHIIAKTLTAFEPTQVSLGAITRKAASSTLTYYVAYHDKNADPQTEKMALAKNVTGTFTSLANELESYANDEKIECDCDGSTIRALKDDTEVHSETDTAITGNLQTGIFTWNNSTNTVSTGDDFEAADLAAAVGGPPWHPYRVYLHNLGR